MTRKLRNAAIYVSRMSSTPDDADEYRLELCFEDGSREKIDVRMSASQFAEMLTAKVTRVYVTHTTREP